MKIEVGKYYKRRDGLKCGPIAPTRSAYYPFAGDTTHYNGDVLTNTYTDRGKALNDNTDHQQDLIEEWQDPVAETVPENFFDDGHTEPAAEPAVSDDPYYPLQTILNEAYNQAAHGKGRERHANDRDFIDQPIMEIGRMCGPGFNTGQAMKKIQEAMGMLSRGQDDAAIRELLGAINYTASAVILIRERPPLVTVTS